MKSLALALLITMTLSAGATDLSKLDCEAELKGWPRVLVSFVRQAIDAKLVDVSKIQDIADGKIWLNPVIGTVKSIHNIFIRDGISKSLARVKDEERALVRTALQKLTSRSFENRNKTVQAQFATRGVFKPKRLPDFKMPAQTPQRLSGTNFTSATVDGRPVHVGVFFQEHPDKTSVIVFDPFHPDETQRAKVIHEEAEHHGLFQVTTITWKGSAYAISLAKDFAYDLTHSRKVKLTDLGFEEALKIQLDPRLMGGMKEYLTPQRRYVFYWNTESVALYSMDNSEWKTLYASSNKNLKVVHINGRDILIKRDIGSHQFYVLSSESAENLPLIEAFESYTEMPQVFFDQGQHYVLFRKDTSTNTWSLVRHNLETGERREFRDSKAFTGDLQVVTSSEGIPYAFYSTMADVATMVDLRTMQEVQRFEITGHTLSTFEFNEAPYILTDTDIIEVSGNRSRIPLRAFLPDKVIQPFVHDGFVYAYFIGDQGLPVLMQLTQEVSSNLKPGLPDTPSK